MMSEEDEDVLFDRSGVLVIDRQQLLPNNDDDSNVNDSPLLESPVHLAEPQPVVVASKGRVFQTVCLCAAFFGLVSTSCSTNMILIIKMNHQIFSSIFRSVS